MGVVDRLVLRDEQWKRISPYILGDDRTPGSSGWDPHVCGGNALDCPHRLAVA